MPTPQSELQIQCNTCQVTNAIFFADLEQQQQKNLKNYMETQKTPNRHSNLKKNGTGESGSLIPDYTTKIQ